MIQSYKNVDVLRSVIDGIKSQFADLRRDAAPPSVTAAVETSSSFVLRPNLPSSTSPTVSAVATPAYAVATRCCSFCSSCTYNSHTSFPLDAPTTGEVHAHVAEAAPVPRLPSRSEVQGLRRACISLLGSHLLTSRLAPQSEADAHVAAEYLLLALIAHTYDRDNSSEVVGPVALGHFPLQILGFDPNDPRLSALAQTISLLTARSQTVSTIHR